jgi:hypothetical protein
MNSREVLKYVELKSGYSDNGPAWIGYVRTSRTEQTIYFNDRALQKAGRGTYRDIETGDIYWISGVKKDGQDRHWAGSGKVQIEKRAIDSYLSLLGTERLDKSKYVVIDALMATDVEKFRDLLNDA